MITSSMCLMLQIALRREKMGETAPFWRFSAASYPDLEETIPTNALFRNVKRSLNGNSNTSPGVFIYLFIFFVHSTSEYIAFSLLITFSILF